MKKTQNVIFTKSSLETYDPRSNERYSECSCYLNVLLLHWNLERRKVAPLAGIEPATFRLGGKCSSN